MEASGHERRYISNSQFGDNTNIYQGDVHLHAPHKQARAEVKAVRAIPYPRNEDLVSRPDLINKLDELLPQTPGFYSAALWGLGGSGKTQLALHYAYQRCNDDECCVFWVHADSEATFTTDYKTIGKKLGVSETLDGSELLDAVRGSIEAQPRWVIVFDNADDLKLFGVVGTNRTNESLYKYIPQGSHGTVLWTTRDAHIRNTLVGSTRGIMVPPMTRDEATSLLAAASGDTSAVEDAEIDRLLEELQRLPLAVSQAGSYIRRTSMTIREYLELLMQGSSRRDLLNMNGFDRHRRPEVSNSVLETWKISTTRIREESELSYRILHVIAYLDNQDIPYELIMAASQYNAGDKGKAKQVSEIEVQQAVSRLVEFSFLDARRGEEGLRSYEMHKLVQEAVRYGLWVQGRMEMAQDMITTTGQNSAEKGEAYYASMTLQIVDDMFPASEKPSRAKCDKYMAHAIRVGEWAEVSGKMIETAALLSKVSWLLFDQGRWRGKEPVDRRVVDLRKNTLGERHPETLKGMLDLAGAYLAQGRYDEAERICTKALSLQQELLGEKHQDTTRSMQLLAIIYTDQARYFEAEGILNQALNVQYELLGERHPDTIWTMSCLAGVYDWQGQYSKAEGLCKQALDLRQKVLGENHPLTIMSMGELVSIYGAQGHYDKAEELQNRVLDFQREVYGEKHPKTIWAMAALAIAYCAQERFTEAGRIQNQVFDLCQEVLGEKHPYTIRIMAHVAWIFCAQGQFDKAERMQRQALDIQRESLGEKHLSTITTMANLGLTHQRQKRYHEADGLYKQALTLQQETLGENHPYILTTLQWRADAFKEQGQYAKAEEIIGPVLDLRRELLGEKHPVTNATRRSLGVIYHKQGRYREAGTMYKQALTIQQEALGENHPQVLLTLGWLAETYVGQGQLDEAEQVQRQLLHFQQEALGKKHPETIYSIKYLKIIKVKQVLSLGYLFRRLKE